MKTTRQTRVRTRTSEPARSPQPVSVAREPGARAVCEHLLPLLQRLVHQHGLRLVERAEGLGSGLGFLFDAALPLDDLADVPHEPFVHVIASRGLIFCERCWQSLGEWQQLKDDWN